MWTEAVIGQNEKAVGKIASSEMAPSMVKASRQPLAPLCSAFCSSGMIP